MPAAQITKPRWFYYGQDFFSCYTVINFICSTQSCGSVPQTSIDIIWFSRPLYVLQERILLLCTVHLLSSRWTIAIPCAIIARFRFTLYQLPPRNYFLKPYCFETHRTQTIAIKRLWSQKRVESYLYARLSIPKEKHFYETHIQSALQLTKLHLMRRFVPTAQPSRLLNSVKNW